MKTYEMTDDRTEFDRYQAIFSNTGMMDDLRDKTELAMREHGEPDFEIYRPGCFDAYFPYSTRNPDQKANYYIAMFAVAQNEHNMQYVPTELRTTEFINTAFMLNPRVVKFLPHEDVNFDHVAVVAKYKPELLEFMGVNKNRYVAATAVTVNPSVFLTLSKDMQVLDDIRYIAANRAKNSTFKQEFYDKNIAYIKDVLKMPVETQTQVEQQLEARKKAKASGLVLTQDRRKKGTQ